MVHKVDLRNKKMMSSEVWGFVHAHRHSGVVQCEGWNGQWYIGGRGAGNFGESREY